VERRKLLKLSRAELARRVGVKPQSLEPIENGEVRRTGYLLEIAEVLETSPEWLCGLTDDPSEHVVSKRLGEIVSDVEQADKEEAIRMLEAWRAAKPRRSA